MDPKVAAPEQVTVTAQPQAPPAVSYSIPPPVNHTTVIVQQPAMMSHMGPRVWSSDICSCFADCSSCMLGTFCPIILSCQVASQMGESACVPCCVPNYLNILRTKLRTEQNIQGSVMDDCCMSTCCGPCALCQLSRELDYIRTMQQ